MNILKALGGSRLFVLKSPRPAWLLPPDTTHETMSRQRRRHALRAVAYEQAGSKTHLSRQERRKLARAFAAYQYRHARPQQSAA